VEVHWLYETTWSAARQYAHEPKAKAVGIIIGVPTKQTTWTYKQDGAHNSMSLEHIEDSWNAIVLAYALVHGDTGRAYELHTASITLAFMQAHAARNTPAPVWICTRCMPGVRMGGSCTHAGLWGFARSCRQEAAKLPLWCLDMSGEVAQSDNILGMLVGSEALRLPDGVVRGLQLNSSLEPEAVVHGSALSVPRLVAPLDTQLSSSLDAGFECIRTGVDLHTSSAMAGLDVAELTVAYDLLNHLCNQYVCDGMRELCSESVPVWHHKLLLSWGAKLPPSPSEDRPSADAVLAAHADLWAELQLADVCGPRFADAVTGVVAYQELLFPSGSMELTRPVYEDAVSVTYYNRCVVAAIEVALAQQPTERRISAVEVGAGTGGTASSVLPVVDGSCERYVFTDVSDVFLRQARKRFAAYDFIEYVLLNIDADPRFQGFGAEQYDFIVATNVLHATPFMRNTLRHCRQLLRPAGLAVVNELLGVSTLVQMTFGLTDGWWLFSECRDVERVGQNCPLLTWRQWESLLADSGFEASHCMQGVAFLRGPAVVVAQAAARATARRSAALDKGAHFFSGGLGGLGLLTARLLIEGGARQVVLSSRSDRVVAGSEGDWAWLSRHGELIRRTRCDVSDDVSVRGAMWSMLGGGVVRLGSVFHAAHQLADAVLANQSSLNFRATYGPKVHGAQALHFASSCSALTFFNVYSSASGLLGTVGQAPHSAANSWLDAMAGCRLRLGVRGQSVNWGAVAEVGYAARAGADRRAAAAGIGAISRSMTLSALRISLFPASRGFAVLPADWSRVLADARGEAIGFLSACARFGAPRAAALTKPTPALPQTPSAAPVCTVGLDTVLELVGRTAGGAVDADAPLMEAGVDSLGAVELRSQLQQAAGVDVKLPSTLVFDHPTVRQLADHLEARLPHASRVPTPVARTVSLETVLELVRSTAGNAVDVDAPLMEAGVDSLGAVELRTQLQQVCGEGVKLPSTVVFDHPTARQLTAMLAPVPLHDVQVGLRQVHGSNVSLQAPVTNLPHKVPHVWLMSAVGYDTVTQVPLGRWAQPGSLEPIIARRSQYAAFMEGIHLFDHSIFKVSVAEARNMDPQQRLLLESAYETLHASHYGRQDLLGIGMVRLCRLLSSHIPVTS
jgi:acyl carrier protein/SAM-dependent methyltransferase